MALLVIKLLNCSLDSRLLIRILATSVLYTNQQPRAIPAKATKNAVLATNCFCDILSPVMN